MESGQTVAKPVSRNQVLAILAISLIALGASSYSIATRELPEAPPAQRRSFLISIDFYNATSGSTSYLNARFTPDTITVFEDDTVVLNVTNRDPRAISPTAGQHGFTVQSLTTGTTVDPGATISETFTPTTEGIYRYFCQLHTAHLSGQLIVKGRD